MRHIISIKLENEAGALSRVAGLFSARGFNIESLSVAATNDPTLSHMTIVSVGNDAIIEQITKQLNKLIDVIEVKDISKTKHIERELLLLKIALNKKLKNYKEKQKNISQCKIIDSQNDVYTIELSNTSEQINSFLDKFDQSEILEISRTGVIATSMKKIKNNT
jgi:acetolactate synthase-1/3 small subunit